MKGRELKEYLKSHYDYEAAELLGCHVSVIYEFRQRAKIPNYATIKRKQNVLTAARLKAEGKTIGEIASIMGLSNKQNIHRYLMMYKTYQARMCQEA